jgi:hypothetical protein
MLAAMFHLPIAFVLITIVPWAIQSGAYFFDYAYAFKPVHAEYLPLMNF